MTVKSAASVREFAEKIVPVIINSTVLCNTEEIVEAFTGDLTALISEHYYPKAFTKWFRSEEFFKEFDEYVEDGKTYWEKPGSILIFEAIDELFNYWKENVR